MSEFWEDVTRRHGLLTTAEGVAEFERSGFYRRVRAGQFVLVHRGVWRVAGSPHSERQVLLGLTLAFRASASFRSTLALHRVPGFTLYKPELTRVGTAHLSRDLGELTKRVTLHRTTFMPEHHLEEIDGIRTTTLVRALCDISAVTSVERLAKTIDACKRLDLVDYDDLAKCREELRARGRRRTTFLDIVLEDRAGGWVVGDSPPEDKTRRWLEGAGFKPVVQHWVVANGRRRRIDVALPSDKVAIEYQGLKEHATTSAVINDSEKVTDLQLAGWFVVVVTKKTTRHEFLQNVRQAVQIQQSRAR